MKACSAILVMFGAIALGLAPVLAQPGNAHHGAAAPHEQQPPAGPVRSGGTGGMPMGPGMGGPMGGTSTGGMTCPMMGGTMGGGMSMMGGMMGATPMVGASDPRTLGTMLQLRGELMEAAGEVFLGYGKQLEAGQTPPGP